jgi:hypothetical protein
VADAWGQECGIGSQSHNIFEAVDRSSQTRGPPDLVREGGQRPGGKTARRGGVAWTTLFMT